MAGNARSSIGFSKGPGGRPSFGTGKHGFLRVGIPAAGSWALNDPRSVAAFQQTHVPAAAARLSINAQECWNLRLQCSNMGEKQFQKPNVTVLHTSPPLNSNCKRETISGAPKDHHSVRSCQPRGELSTDRKQTDPGDPSAVTSFWSSYSLQFSSRVCILRGKSMTNQCGGAIRRRRL